VQARASTSCDVAFIKDPDGYWIEIVQADLLKKLGD
jgi:hypothetical protein